MKTLRTMWLEPVLMDLRDPENTDFSVLEVRLRSAYHKLESDFRMKAPGTKSLCSNLAYIYELVGGTHVILFVKILRFRNFLSTS